MISICERFVRANNLTFNPAKSLCLHLRPNGPSTRSAVYLDGSLLLWVNSVTHLGHVLTYNLRDESDIAAQHNAFLVRFNTVVPSLSYLSTSVRQAIFKTYCSTFYGSVLWRLGPPINPISVSWRKAVRRAFSLPPNTHCNILPCLINSLSPEHSSVLNFQKFVVSCLNSRNLVLRRITNLSLSAPRYLFGFNCRYIQWTYRETEAHILRAIFISSYLNEEACVILDIIDSLIPGFTDLELEDILINVATQ